MQTIIAHQHFMNWQIEIAKERREWYFKRTKGSEAANWVAVMNNGSDRGTHHVVVKFQINACIVCRSCIIHCKERPRKAGRSGCRRDF